MAANMEGIRWERTFQFIYFIYHLVKGAYDRK